MKKRRITGRKNEERKKENDWKKGCRGRKEENEEREDKGRK
jgi:hypothetical protein